MDFVYYLANRLKEPSTYAGISSLLTGVGVVISPEHWQAIMGFAMGLGGLIAILLPARVTKSQVKPDAGT